jgi:hypothetical protein
MRCNKLAASVPYAFNHSSSNSHGDRSVTQFTTNSTMVSQLWSCPWRAKRDVKNYTNILFQQKPAANVGCSAKDQRALKTARLNVFTAGL